MTNCNHCKKEATTEILIKPYMDDPMIEPYTTHLCDQCIEVFEGWGMKFNYDNNS